MRHFDHPLLTQIQKDFFPEESPIVIDVTIEGQEVRDQKYVIGPWAGPEADIENLFHEMGHFADREIKQLEKYPNSSWGYHYGQYWEIGHHYGWEPQTDQSVKREARCWAFQISLMSHYQLKVETKRIVRPARFMPAFALYQKTLNETQKIQKLATEVQELSKTSHTYDKFCQAWQVRTRHLKEGLCTHIVSGPTTSLQASRLSP